MIKRKQNKGFTLIEVTLAIVIGIIMIAGATLIYNQAKTSAGNSRAQAKVVGLQQLVEEYAAQNQGIYPNLMSDINALWQRKRPDDFNKSPWGGVLGSAYNPTAAGVAGVAGWTAANAFSTSGTPGAFNLAGNSLATPTMVGGLFYSYDANNVTFSYTTDLMTNQAATVKGYGVYIADQQGRYPNFVTGGKNQ